MIRRAKYGDIPEILEILKDMHARSIYAERATFSDSKAKNLVVASLNAGANNSGCVLVSEKDGEVEGFIIGALDNIHGISREKYATDLFFCMKQFASPKAAIALAKAFDEWANTTDAIEIRVGVTDVVGADWERKGLIWERCGLDRAGGFYAKELNP